MNGWNWNPLLLGETRRSEHYDIPVFFSINPLLENKSVIMLLGWWLIQTALISQQKFEYYYSFFFCWLLTNNINKSPHSGESHSEKHPLRAAAVATRCNGSWIILSYLWPREAAISAATTTTTTNCQSDVARSHLGWCSFAGGKINSITSKTKSSRKLYANIIIIFGYCFGCTLRLEKVAGELWVGLGVV